MNTRNPSPDLATFTDDCKICGILNINMQDHVFSNGHISQVKLLLDCGKLNDSNDAISQSSSQQQQQQHTIVQSQNSSMPLPSVSSGSSTQQVVTSSESIGFYNQFLLQNHLFGQQASVQANTRQQVSPSVSTATGISVSSDVDNSTTHTDELNATRSLAGSEIGNNLHQNQTSETQILMENNVLLQINADNASTTNSEILQQLYNYSHMSGELIK